MPPLVMPWCLRKPSSVCTNTSKIALPMPRTSYFAAVIDGSCVRQLRRCGESAPSRLKMRAAAYHDRPCASKPHRRVDRYDENDQFKFPGPDPEEPGRAQRVRASRRMAACTVVRGHPSRRIARAMLLRMRFRVDTGMPRTLETRY